ncbi:MAG: AIR synthase related protein, partial [Flavobacteriales bacterium]|nr:AIR synthase related protein [Flavobacteriales bacterium]
MSDTTNINELGEFGLIQKLTSKFERFNSSTMVGIGDDAAVVNQEEGVMLVSTDMLTEGVHFDMMYAPLKHLGYKAITVNLSDIVAMNGQPKQVLVSIAVSSRFTVEALEELYEGIRAACNNYKV